MLQRQREALALLAQAVHLGAPEGYIRHFVTGGAAIATLLSQLREQELQEEDRPYLETLVHVSNQRLVPPPAHLESESCPSPSQPLLDPLSAREQEVLRLLARGASNQDMADALVVVTSTIKHHVSNILSKLEVSNHTQAIARARVLGLLSSDPLA